MTDNIIIYSIINEMIDNVEQTNKNDIMYRFLSRSNEVVTSLYINRYYFMTVFVCIIFLFIKQKTKSLIKNIYLFNNLCLSYVFMIIWGWYIHFISHNINVSELYEFLLKNNHKNWLDNTLLFIFKYTIDFHDQIHHNTSINKQYLFLFIEFIQNILTQGGILFFFGIDKLINKYIILLWCLTYTTVHLINYNIPSIKHCHKDHHTNCKTNYGIDYMDIIMGTKFNYQDIENINHYSINIILITILLYKYIE
jgi:hypothetical protein